MCVYIASGDSYDTNLIIFYSILAIVFSLSVLVIRLKTNSAGFRNSYVDLKIALIEHSSTIIDDKALLNIYRKCEEKITMHLY